MTLYIILLEYGADVMEYVQVQAMISRVLPIVHEHMKKAQVEQHKTYNQQAQFWES